MPPPPRPRVAKSTYVHLAAWRRELRRFLHFSQEAARRAGVTPQQHQALLALKGTPDRDHASVGELAEHLQLRHHSMVGLLDRLVRRRLVRRTTSPADHRCVQVRLTPRGEALIRRLSAVHVQELRQLGPHLRRLLRSLGRA